MRTTKQALASALFALMALTAFNVSAQSADNGRFLSITPPEGLPIIPVLEGWIDNQDGTTSFSFGIINRNEEAIDIPLGEANYLVPEKHQGIQPTHFPAGRSTGAFTVTVPNDERETDVWWHIKTGNSEELKVPGRYGAGAYELDFIRPRPQGALQPLVGIGTDGNQLPGLYAQIGNFPGGTVSVGEQVELIVNATDPAVRDETDPRFGEPLSMGVEWNKYQGPGEVVFTRHETTEVPENPYNENDPRFPIFPRASGQSERNRWAIGNGACIRNILRARGIHHLYQGDIHEAPDSSNGDQCCWTNVYQRVTVR